MNLMLKKIKKVVKKENKNLNDKTDKNSNFSNIIKGQKQLPSPGTVMKN